MKIIEPFVELINAPDYKTLLTTIEAAGRTCYKSEDKITDGSAEKFVRGIIKRGHEAVIEHGSLTVRFICDRGVSHEIVRHRLAAFCQESTRYLNIPAELREEKAWVNVWEGSKVPMQATVRKAASSSNPNTWSNYIDAEHNVQHGYYDGLGYVFHDTGVVGIDIDDGFTDGLLNPLAADIIGHCQSYTEKSRSGRGVHILVRGELPFKGKNNRAAVEIYKSNRYFIMTGEVLIFSEIVENQSAINYVIEKYFPDTPKESSSGTVAPQRIYSPIYRRPENGKLHLKPEYPPITPGSRNLSLTSLAGQLHNQGYTKAEIYKELLYANQQACKPPLPQSEVELIVNSVTRYRR